MTQPFSDAVSAAEYYIKSGFSPIPIPWRKKKPTLDGWPKLRMTQDQVAAFFHKQPSNIGLLLGIGGLADVDLDCREAIQLAPLFLPITGMCFGRKSAPRSHHFYYLKPAGIKSMKFRDPLLKGDEATIVEIRCQDTSGGSGYQTVVPPSVHKDTGEPIEFFSAGLPAEVNADVLWRQVAYIASATLLARYWPEEGSRTDARMALAGMLLRYCEKDFTRDFLKAIYSIAPNHDPKDSSVDAEINNTAANLAEGKEITGATTLKKLIDPKVVDQIVDWLHLYDDDEPKESKADQRTRKLLEIVDGWDLFRDQKNQAYVQFQVNSHLECAAVNSKRFQQHLTSVYHQMYQQLVPVEILNQIGTLLSARAFEKDQRETFIRFGHKDGKVYLDLCDDAWRVVEIDDKGWQLLEHSPVPFRRDPAMKCLPEPARDGRIDELFACINAQQAEDRVAYVGWLLSVFMKDGTLPILAIQAEHGAGKSQSERCLRRLVDDSAILLATSPRDERDFVIAMKNSAIAVFDNLSGIPDWLSDALCRSSDGAGMRTRKLTTDDEEMIFAERRPCIVGGIDDLPTRPDLADRCISIHLEPLRLKATQQQLDALFESRWAGILGALLDVVSHGLANLATTPVDPEIRMADFAQWVAACEGALLDIDLGDGKKWEPGTFLKVYSENRQRTMEGNLENDPFAMALVEFAMNMTSKDLCFESTAQGLLDALPRPSDLDEDPRSSKRWPRSAEQLGKRLRRLLPSLRAKGIGVDSKRTGTKGRLFLIERIDAQQELPLEVLSLLEKDNQ